VRFSGPVAPAAERCVRRTLAQHRRLIGVRREHSRMAILRRSGPTLSAPLCVGSPVEPSSLKPCATSSGSQGLYVLVALGSLRSTRARESEMASTGAGWWLREVRSPWQRFFLADIVICPHGDCLVSRVRANLLRSAVWPSSPSFRFRLLSPSSPLQCPIATVTH